MIKKIGTASEQRTWQENIEAFKFMRNYIFYQNAKKTIN